MSRTALTLIAVLSIIVMMLSFYRRHAVAVSYTRSPAVRQSSPKNAPCRCEPAPEILPDTPKGRQRQKEEDAQEKRQEDKLEKQYKQDAQRLYRLVRIGMSRREVRRLMGEPGMTGTPLIESPSAVDADYYAGGDYEVAYSVGDAVVWVGPT